MAAARFIRVRGAREHSLKDVSTDIPRDKLIVLTGLSGSGKSSLAFDTIYAEGKRRYVESLSTYARQIFEQLEKPDVDYVEGLPPTIAIAQKQGASNPRSTVATTTEVHDYLRLLFARAGQCTCSCGAPLRVPSHDEIVDDLLGLPANRRFYLLAPVDLNGGSVESALERIRKDGFARVRLDGAVHELTDAKALVELARRGGGKSAKRAKAVPKGKVGKKGKNKDKGAAPRAQLEIVVDRLSAKPGLRQRIAESLEIALERGDGVAIASVETPTVHEGRIQKLFVDKPISDRYACADCRKTFPDINPRLFSFNAPEGACPQCDGMGTRPELDEELIVPDPKKGLSEGAIEAWRRGGKKVSATYQRLLDELVKKLDIKAEIPFKNLPAEVRRILLHGTTKKDVDRYDTFFEGVIPNLRKKYERTESQQVKSRIHAYMSDQPCSECKGSRLRREALLVTVGPSRGAHVSIAKVLGMSVEDARVWAEGLTIEGEAAHIAPRILGGIKERLKFLKEVGVGYLTLDRASRTLSGGELQRIRLAAQVGSGLAGVCYVLDEPTIGLHQRDNARLIQTLTRLRDAGNTVLVVEHDEQTIRAADHVIDMGPGAGIHGGEIVAQGTLKEIMASERSLTAAYLKGELEVTRTRRRKKGKRALKVLGARANNLCDITVKFPLGGLVCVTGVSGSGKSTLVREVLYKALARELRQGAAGKPGAHNKIAGVSYVDRAVEINQKPIGRSPRSNPATFSGVFNPIRRLFATLKEARIRGYDQSRFSFNVKGGRCEACQGQGRKRIEMHFLPDMTIPCEACGGTRYRREILDVRYRGHSIADVLELNIEQARKLFSSFPRVRAPLKTIEDVGLSYLKLGQSSTTLSGGEAQRLKLASELSRKHAGHTVYILDEPTTGLHFADISRLMDVLNRLARQDSTLIIIEHNLDVVQCADWVIDLGPEGGTGGGQVVCQGPPEAIAACEASHTGRFLKELFAQRAKNRAVAADA